MNTTLKTLLPEEELQKFISQVPYEETPLGEYWRDFVNEWERIGRSETTVRSVRNTIRFTLRHTSVRSIEQCNNQRTFGKELHEVCQKRGCSHSTINTYLKNLKTYFRWLENMDYIEENKLKKIYKCKPVFNEQLTLTGEQIDKIINHLTNARRQTRLQRKRNLFFLNLLRYTGARPIEMQNLKLEDVMRKGNRYQIRINGAKQKGKPRYYPMPSWLKDQYIDYRTHRNILRPNEDCLFISTSKRTGWTTKGMQGLIKKLQKELGFPITMYGFRRYVATKLHTEGVDIHKIKDYLGHTRVTTTQGYIEQSCARTEEAGEIMGENLS